MPSSTLEPMLRRRILSSLVPDRMMVFVHDLQSIGALRLCSMLVQTVTRLARAASDLMHAAEHGDMMQCSLLVSNRDEF